MAKSKKLIAGLKSWKAPETMGGVQIFSLMEEIWNRTKSGFICFSNLKTTEFYRSNLIFNRKIKIILNNHKKCRPSFRNIWKLLYELEISKAFKLLCVGIIS